MFPQVSGQKRHQRTFVDKSRSDPRHLRAPQLPGPSWYSGPALAADLEGLLAGLDLGWLAGGLGAIEVPDE